MVLCIFVLNLRGTYESSPLVWAVWRGQEEVVRFLLDQEGVEERDGKNDTALVEAAWEEHPGVVELLLGAGADPTARNWEGRTALHRAAYYGLVGVLAQMVGKGAQVDARDQDGETAVYWASEGGEEAAVRMLAALGADLALVDKSGRSPLHLAASNNNPRVAAALVELGCPLHLVSHPPSIPLLQVDSWGWTALEVATEEGNHVVVAMLSPGQVCRPSLAYLHPPGDQLYSCPVPVPCTVLIIWSGSSGGLLSRQHSCFEIK